MLGWAWQVAILGGVARNGLTRVLSEQRLREDREHAMKIPGKTIPGWEQYVQRS